MSAGTISLPAREIQEAGCKAISVMLLSFTQLPGVLKPGFESDEDDSDRHDYEAGAELILRTLDGMPREAFAFALSVYLCSAAANTRWDLDWFKLMIDEIRGRERRAGGTAPLLRLVQSGERSNAPALD